MAVDKHNIVDACISIFGLYVESISVQNVLKFAENNNLSQIFD